MDTTSIPGGAVVVGVDGSEHSDRAVAWAADEARLAGRPLVLAHATGLVLEADPYAVRVLHELQFAGQALVDARAARVGERLPGLQVHTAVRTLHPRQMLLDLAAQASLLVVGSRGHGPVRSVLLGSVSLGLAREAACPVVVVRPYHPGVVRRGVLVGADGTVDSVPVLDYAYRHASFHGLPLTVLYCVSDPPAGATDTPAPLPTGGPAQADARLRLSESVAGFGERYPDVRAHLVTARRPCAPALVAAATRTDLVVVGRHDRSRVGSLLMGSVSAKVVEHAACPVAVVPVPQSPAGNGTYCSDAP